ncbi:MAG: DNA-binding protein [Proteobacteria bacterium]|nr:DNA-binding protein [Pseudomonadota bacterium]
MTNRIKSAEGAPGRMVAARLMPGSNLMSGIAEVCEKHNIKSGILASGIGSLSKTTYLDPIPKPELKAKYGYGDPMTADGPIELLNLAGAICHSDEGKVLLHVHATMCLADGKAFGGHLTDEGNEVLLTADVTILEIANVDFVRRLDEETGILMYSPTPKCIVVDEKLPEKR